MSVILPGFHLMIPVITKKSRYILTFLKAGKPSEVVDLFPLALEDYGFGFGSDVSLSTSGRSGKTGVV